MQMGLSFLSAEEVVNTFDEKNSQAYYKNFGDEKEASKIARNIIISRRKKEFQI